MSENIINIQISLDSTVQEEDPHALSISCVPEISCDHLNRWLCDNNFSELPKGTVICLSIYNDGHRKTEYTCDVMEDQLVLSLLVLELLRHGIVVSKSSLSKDLHAMYREFMMGFSVTDISHKWGIERAKVESLIRSLNSK